jgi:hypothetical protein
MSAATRPFTPDWGESSVASASGAAATYPITGEGQTLRIYNSGTGIVWFRLGDANVPNAGLVTDMPIPAGAVAYVTRNKDQDTHINVVAVSGTHVLYITPGEGGRGD